MKSVYLKSAFQEAANKIDINCLLELNLTQLVFNSSKCQGAIQTNELNNHISGMTLALIILQMKCRLQWNCDFAFF